MRRRNAVGQVVSALLAALVVAVLTRGSDLSIAQQAIVELVPGGDIEEINADYGTFVLDR